MEEQSPLTFNNNAALLSSKYNHETYGKLQIICFKEGNSKYVM